MQATTTVPVSITDDAAEQIRAWGQQNEFEQMLAHTKRTIGDLRGIEVTLEYDFDQPVEPIVLITSHRPHPESGDDLVDNDWGRWFVDTFPGEVCIHFVMMSMYGAPTDGR